MSKLGIKPVHLFSIVFLSFLFFRGRLGSDDIEVFNFVKYFIISELSLKEFLANIITFKGESLEQDIQLASMSTWGHRFIWIIQTFIITKVIYFFSNFFDFDKLFFSQYFSGYILTFYSFLAYLIIFLYLNKKENLYYSFLLSSIIFFGTGIISFFTGSYIESLILLLFVFREISENFKKKILCDLLIILIKPYYLIYIIFLYFYDDKNLIKNAKIFLFLIFMYLSIKSLINSISPLSSTDIFLSFLPGFDVVFILKNLFYFYFSFGVGIFFSSTVIIILFVFGFKKKSIFKIVGLLFLSIFLCMWEGFHGYAPGGRYFLPIIITFLPEIQSGFSKVIKNIDKLKFRLYFNIFFVLLILNLPVLEYRNTNLTSYLNSSVYKNSNPNFILVENNEMILLNTPIEDISYNQLVFSNKIIFNKIFNIDKFYIKDKEVQLKSTYPMTGIARIIFISNNNIKIYGEKLIKFSDSIKVILITLYFAIASIFVWFMFFCYLNINKLNNQK